MPEKVSSNRELNGAKRSALNLFFLATALSFRAVNAVAKTVGKRKRGEGPVECFWRAQALIGQLDLLNPHPRPRGFVQKFRSYEDYEK